MAGKKKEDKQEDKAIGRPTDYSPEYDLQAFKLCLLGATDKELADFFDVVESTINLWKLKYPSFSESIKNGKIKADSEAAESLYKRFKGYKYTEKTYEVNSEGERTLTKEIEKEIPPDTAAAFIWLKNRRSKQWRDKQEIELTDNSDRAALMKKARERAGIGKKTK